MCAGEKLVVSRLAREGTRAGLCTKHLSPSFRSLKDISEGGFLGSFSQSQALPAIVLCEGRGWECPPQILGAGWEPVNSLCKFGDSNTINLQ